jgi:hypothetical protein
MLNLGIQYGPFGAVVRDLRAFGIDLTLPSPDWSRDLVIDESDRSHWWSKFLGGEGLVTLATLGVGELAEAARAGGAAARETSSFSAIKGRARLIPLHNTTTPWYRFLSPKYKVTIWVKTAGRRPTEIAQTWSHELQHFSDIERFPGIAHLAARETYFPGCGVARYLIEFRGYGAGRTLHSLRTPLQSFNATQLRWLNYDLWGTAFSGVAGIGEGIYFWFNDHE